MAFKVLNHPPLINCVRLRDSDLLVGQTRISQAKALIIGLGGLGCPAAAYLAGAGVSLGLVDGDRVEISNLHRQILHQTATVGMFKVDSAADAIARLNPEITCTVVREHLTPQNALDVAGAYDILLDCSDNPATRYLISDIAVLLGKPLVSASALRTEGQLMVLNYPPISPGDATGGPCYRCVFPKPPPAQSVVPCAEGGILGPVVGTMGTLQALEAIKILTSDPLTASTNIPEPSLLLFSGYGSPPFRSIRLRKRRKGCAACGEKPSISLQSLKSGSMDYVQFCGSLAPVDLLAPEDRISATTYKNTILDDAFNTHSHVLVDTRDKTQFDLCNLPGSINIPISKIQAAHTAASMWPEGMLNSLPTNASIFMICRLGNDSQLAVKKMKELELDGDGKRRIQDVKGGFAAWREHVDPEWPDY